MACLVKQVKHLYEQELYSNCVSLATMVITIGENSFGDYITPQETFQVYCYYGDALFQLQQYRKAETMYRRALQLRKSLRKTRGSSKLQENGASNKELQPDTEVKYKMHICYVNMKQTQSSIDILQSITAKQRSAKINIALGQAYERAGLARPAATAYREALRVCPFALEAADSLLKLMVKPVEVLAIVSEAATGPDGSLVIAWLNARAQFHSRDWTNSIRSFKALDQPCVPLRGCPLLLTSLGETQYYAGFTKQAVVTFQRAHSADPLMLRGLGQYAACLSHEGLLRDRSPRLVPQSLLLSEYCKEHWVVLGFAHRDAQRLPRAAYFAQKACMMDPRDPEPLLLKGSILLAMKKHPEALAHFRQALQSAPMRFEAYMGLAETHIAMRRPREAMSVAANCFKAMPTCPRTLTLYANALIKEGGAASMTKARAILEKALVQDEAHLPAALALARVLDSDDDQQASIDLLEKQIVIAPSASLHQALGDKWAGRGGTGGAERAFHHYMAALNLKPGSRPVLEALAQLDRTPSHGQPNATPHAGVDDTDNTCDMVAEPNVQSDNSNGQEESETEAVWSDMDLEMP